jgi:conjugal transfer ATP-binding protein TraC
MPPKDQDQFKNIKQIIAPAGAQVTPSNLKIGDKLAKTFFVFSYPRYLATGWFEPLINLPNLYDVSIFINPIDTGTALKNLRKKAGQIESQINDEEEKGLVRNPVLETAMRDVEGLRDALQQSEEKLFNTGVYITIYADNEADLARLEGKLISMMEAKLIYI